MTSPVPWRSPTPWRYDEAAEELLDAGGAVIGRIEPASGRYAAAAPELMAAALAAIAYLEALGEPGWRDGTHRRGSVRALRDLFEEWEVATRTALEKAGHPFEPADPPAHVVDVNAAQQSRAEGREGACGSQSRRGRLR